MHLQIDFFNAGLEMGVTFSSLSSTSRGVFPGASPVRLPIGARPVRAGSRAACLGAVLAVVAMALVAVPPAVAAPRSPAAELAHMQQLVNDLRSQYSAPGAGFTFGDGHHDVTLSSGTRDILVPHPIESTDRVRVGSGSNPLKPTLE